ncbi:TPA: tRNA (adenosine(37)-N6)-dimethylallyltransferase MiaA [Candidatus Dependentiae bacterium]|nr:MAG: tRNA dimethylallyltransferase [candidate division TM6 bacterium GW2011_GWE2_31_21]KKP53583.1 MAG: tRNA dimethylallyltransferase [candidate division TM6 bacterium GW2011_GWF2_33_332]HBS48177.1 tRNA (adenosine(37)-N6)-dimethylallyltransferase MiaA [Candidatus Dependentiae bacterium]HBZ73601.1 tRNA (adenosine(37)-N6)-dimethylallyltransferase MiaA [Candidatus Dependentiae bacterium]
MTEINKNQNTLIISGPTASGKTSLSLQLASFFDGEIINADMGQFYEPFEIGTAKPDWKNEKIPHHLFDIITTPENLTVCKYRELVLDKIFEVQKRGKLPIIVGGSLFYLKTLFFPPSPINQESSDLNELPIDENLTPWEFLNKIDPVRAQELHSNDLYRINRAIKIWQTTKMQPSKLKPKPDLQFNAFILFLNPPKEVLEKNIRIRTQEMIAPINSNKSWIDEVKKIVGTPWEDFLREKKFIGYPELLDWIGKNDKFLEKDIDFLIENIVIKTRQYAKRQITFWKKLKKELKSDFLQMHFRVELFEVEDSSKFEDVSNKINFFYKK